MGGARKLAVLVLTLACAAALTACGGSGSSTDTTAGSTAQATTGTTAGGEAGNGGGQHSQPEGSGGGKSSEPKGEGSGGGSGSGSKERSTSFRTPGGDNSIQEFGEEAGAEERAEATKTITLFFGASKAQEWAKVCGVLSAKALAQMSEFAKQSPQLKGKNCAAVIKLVYSSARSGPLPEAIKGGVISLRREGGQSFALYHGVDGKNYAFPLVLENGEWKLIGLGATPLSEL